MDTRTLTYYQQNAPALAAQYSKANNPVADFVSLYLASSPGAQVLDAGCGTGKVAQDLFAKGFSVSACDPVPALYQLLAKSESSIQFFESNLEDLLLHKQTYQGVSCQAVLQHLPDTDLVSSLTGLVEVCDAQGYLFVSVPLTYPLVSQERDEKGRLFILRDKNLYIHLFRRLGCRLVHYVINDDSLDRPGIQWVLMIFQKESRDGSSPIRMIDSIIREDKKVTTYKFALLRSIVDLALQRPNLARYEVDDLVSIPKEDLVDRWIEYYWPLVEYSVGTDPGPGIIYQGQKITDKQDIGFRSSLESIVDHYKAMGGIAGFLADIRSPQRLSKEIKQKYSSLSKGILKAISQPIFYAGNKTIGQKVFFEQDNRVYMPAGMWYEFSHFGTWIIDSLILRWAEMTSRIQPEDSQSALITKEQVLSLLLNESLPDRYTAYMRNLYNPFVAQNQITCVWSGATIKNSKDYQVDHVLPYSLWYNNDMWNLLPASNAVNNEKRDKLPTLRFLNKAQPRILELWDLQYQQNPGLFLHQASLFSGAPKLVYSKETGHELFVALRDTIELGARQRNLVRWEL